MTGRIVLGPALSGTPHICQGMPPAQPDNTMVGTIWRCDECGRYWQNRQAPTGGVWIKILPEQARQLIDAHPERVPT